MAEVGLVASVFGIASLGASLSKALGYTMRHARDQIDEIASEVTTFTTIIRELGAVLTGAALGTALLVVLLTILVHHVEGYLVGPFVLGRAVRLPAFVILLALATGAELAGVLGAFIAVPLTAIAVDCVDELRRTPPVAGSGS